VSPENGDLGSATEIRSQNGVLDTMLTLLPDGQLGDRHFSGFLYNNSYFAASASSPHG